MNVHSLRVVHDCISCANPVYTVTRGVRHKHLHCRGCYVKHKSHLNWIKEWSLRPPRPERQCVICCRYFTPRRAETITCSVICRNDRNEEKNVRRAHNWQSMSQQQRDRKNYTRMLWVERNKEYVRYKTKQAYIAKNPPIIKACIECGGQFSSRRTSTTTCSKTCLWKINARKHARSCPVCGMMFWGRSQGSRTCSAVCSLELKRLSQELRTRNPFYRAALRDKRKRDRDISRVAAETAIKLGLVQIPLGLSKLGRRRWQNDVRRAMKQMEIL